MKNEKPGQSFKKEARTSVEELINAAYFVLDPPFGAKAEPEDVQRTAQLLDSIHARLLARMKQSDTDQVISLLPEVPPLAKQIAKDRKQFPALDAAGRANTKKFLDTSKNIAISFIKTLSDNKHLPDADKLTLAHHARLHVYAALVYQDRLDNATPTVPQPKKIAPSR